MALSKNERYDLLTICLGGEDYETAVLARYGNVLMVTDSIKSIREKL